MDSARIEIDSLLDSRPLSGLQIKVIVFCALAILFDGYDVQLMALTVPVLSSEWGLPPVSFAAALTTSILGMGIGAALLAPMGDRIGRRVVLIASLLAVGLSGFGCATADSTIELVFWRFLTGLGLGGSMPNAFALTADYMPRKRRAMLLIVMYCNMATGALLASLTAPWLFAQYGWQGPFVVGGILPIAVAALLLMAAPESLKFLLHRRPTSGSIPSLVRAIAPEVDPACVYAQPPPVTLAGSIRDLLIPLYRSRTLLLWVSYALNAFVLYLVVSWLPTLLKGAGWSTSQALQAVALNQLGGIFGGLGMAWLINRIGAERMLAGVFGLSTVVLLGFQILQPGFWSWGLLLLLTGACFGGAQFAIPTLAANYYPAPILATGTGWASAVARVGAFTAPLAGGGLLAMQLEPKAVLSVLAIPALVAGATMYTLALHSKLSAPT